MRPRGQPHRDRPGPPGPRALRSSKAAWAARSRTAPQVRRADDASKNRGAAGPPHRPDPIRQSGSRALPNLSRRCALPEIEALPVHRTAQILSGNLEVVRYRTCRVAARFLKGRVVRAVWVQLEQPDRGDKPTEERLLICTDPDLSAITVITSYAKRWSIEPLFAAIKHGWGLKDAWQQSRQVLAVAPSASSRAKC